MKKTEELYLRKVNIQRWNSPVAKQYGIRSIPYFIIFGPDGKKIAEGFHVYRRILNWKSPSKKK